MDAPVRNPSLADQVFQILLDRINTGKYPAGSQLPSENELAGEFDVSRSTIRTAVFRLEDRRLVHRRQGVGTYISENINIMNPLNEFIEFRELIKENGFQPGYRHITSAIVTARGEIAEQLELTPEETMLRILKVFTANQDPIIFVINHIPAWIFENKITPEEALDPDLTKHFRIFFEETCQQEVSYFISQVRAEIFQNIKAPPMMDHYTGTTPTLIIDQLGYNKHDRPLVHSREFHPGNWMTFNIIRRWSR